MEISTAHSNPYKYTLKTIEKDFESSIASYSKGILTDEIFEQKCTALTGAWNAMVLLTTSQYPGQQIANQFILKYSLKLAHFCSLHPSKFDLSTLTYSTHPAASNSTEALLLNLCENLTFAPQDPLCRGMVAHIHGDTTAIPSGTDKESLRLLVELAERAAAMNNHYFLSLCDRGLQQILNSIPDPIGKEGPLHPQCLTDHVGQDMEYFHRAMQLPLKRTKERLELLSAPDVPQMITRKLQQFGIDPADPKTTRRLQKIVQDQKDFTHLHAEDALCALLLAFLQPKSNKKLHSLLFNHIVNHHENGTLPPNDAEWLWRMSSYIPALSAQLKSLAHQSGMPFLYRLRVGKSLASGQVFTAHFLRWLNNPWWAGFKNCDGPSLLALANDLVEQNVFVDNADLDALLVDKLDSYTFDQFKRGFSWYLSLPKFHQKALSLALEKYPAVRLMPETNTLELADDTELTPELLSFLNSILKGSARLSIPSNQLLVTLLDHAEANDLHSLFDSTIDLANKRWEEHILIDVNADGDLVLVHHGKDSNDPLLATLIEVVARRGYHLKTRGKRLLYGHTLVSVLPWIREAASAKLKGPSLLLHMLDSGIASIFHKWPINNFEKLKEFYPDSYAQIKDGKLPCTYQKLPPTITKITLLNGLRTEDNQSFFSRINDLYHRGHLTHPKILEQIIAQHEIGPETLFQLLLFQLKYIESADLMRCVVQRLSDSFINNTLSHSTATKVLTLAQHFPQVQRALEQDCITVSYLKNNAINTVRLPRLTCALLSSKMHRVLTDVDTNLNGLDRKTLDTFVKWIRHPKFDGYRDQDAKTWEHLLTMLAFFECPVSYTDLRDALPTLITHRKANPVAKAINEMLDTRFLTKDTYWSYDANRIHVQCHSRRDHLHQLNTFFQNATELSNQPSPVEDVRRLMTACTQFLDRCAGNVAPKDEEHFLFHASKTLEAVRKAGLTARVLLDADITLQFPNGLKLYVSRYVLSHLSSEFRNIKSGETIKLSGSPQPYDTMCSYLYPISSPPTSAKDFSQICEIAEYAKGSPYILHKLKTLLEDGLKPIVNPIGEEVRTDPKLINLKFGQDSVLSNTLLKLDRPDIRHLVRPNARLLFTRKRLEEHSKELINAEDLKFSHPDFVCPQQDLFRYFLYLGSQKEVNSPLLITVAKSLQALFFTGELPRSTARWIENISYFHLPLQKALAMPKVRVVDENGTRLYFMSMMKLCVESELLYHTVTRRHQPDLSLEIELPHSLASALKTCLRQPSTAYHSHLPASEQLEIIDALTYFQIATDCPYDPRRPQSELLGLVNVQTVDILLPLALRYHLPKLLERCWTVASHINIDKSNIVVLWDAALKYRKHGLLNKCHQYISNGHNAKLRLPKNRQEVEDILNLHQTKYIWKNFLRQYGFLPDSVRERRPNIYSQLVEKGSLGTLPLPKTASPNVAVDHQELVHLWTNSNGFIDFVDRDATFLSDLLQLLELYQIPYSRTKLDDLLVWNLNDSNLLQNTEIAITLQLPHLGTECMDLIKQHWPNFEEYRYQSMADLEDIRLKQLLDLFERLLPKKP
ncbi:MAG: hypothetical protein Q8K75_08380 [Chlamydiales bacterium]|nr:hypothetical protein [Chlamydiales bacterium]